MQLHFFVPSRSIENGYNDSASEFMNCALSHVAI